MLLSTSQTQHQMKSWLFLYVVVAQSVAIFKLLASENQPLLVWRNSLFILDFGLHIVNGVTGFNLKGDDEQVVSFLLSQFTCNGQGGDIWSHKRISIIFLCRLNPCSSFFKKILYISLCSTPQLHEFFIWIMFLFLPDTFPFDSCHSSQFNRVSWLWGQTTNIIDMTWRKGTP